MLDVAIEAAKLGGDLAYKYFSKNFKINYKPDKSPQTEADIEAEKLIRKIISKKFPDHGFIGEELGEDKPNARFKWVIDPIDGTKQFIRGLPFWGTLIAVLENGKPIIGVTYFPVFGDLATAEKDKGTYLNDKKARVSKTKDLSRSYLVHGSVDAFKKTGKLDNFVSLCQKVEGRRGFGDSWGYNLLISGKVDILLEGHVYIQDIAATSLLTEEAGGRFSDFDGNFSLTSDNALATNGLLHSQVLKILNT